MNEFSSYSYIAGTVVFTLYGQLVIKWKMTEAGGLPSSIGDKTVSLLSMVINPWMLSDLISAFLASLCWMAAMTKFDLSYAFPFMSLAFILVLIFSALLFHEPVNLSKVFGLILIIAGIVAGVQSCSIVADIYDT